jgi:hypothetical protein
MAYLTGRGGYTICSYLPIFIVQPTAEDPEPVLYPLVRRFI